MKENILRNLNERKNWQEETDLSLLKQKTIINTSKLVNNPENGNVPRKGWDQPHQTIIKALEKVELNEITIKPEITKNKNETFLICKNEMENKNNENSLKNTEIFSTKSIINLTKCFLTTGKFDLKSAQVLFFF